MRPTIIAGNWKMNLGLSEAKTLAEGIKKGLPSLKDTLVWVFPSHLHIPAVVEAVKGSPITVGVQNIHPSDLTAMTGETAPHQAEDFGIKLGLVGHSERRQFHGETNKICLDKTYFLLNRGWKVVYCIGEKLEEREAGKTFEVLSTQIREGLEAIGSDLLKNVILAYEPVWAIGTGKTATPEMAQEAHAFIRKEVASLGSGNDAIAQAMPILYGGSVKPDNIKSLLEKEDIDGGLVGGASQKTDSFLGLL
jgi:triosephosphate isomerase (TIM)